MFVFIAALSLFAGSVQAGRVLHRSMMENVIASPMSFFDTTPLGRILNRFSKDVEILDVLIVLNIRFCIECFLQIVAVPIVVGYSTPLILITMIPLAVFYIAVQVSASVFYFFWMQLKTGLLGIRVFL